MSSDTRPLWWVPTNNRAMLVGRISDKNQEDGVSLDAQRHVMEEYASGVDLEVVAVESFRESAKKSKLRTVFHGTIKKARKEKIRHLVFYVWDRVARNFTDAEMLEEMVRDGEITLHIASGHSVLHSLSPDTDFFMFDINIAQAKQDNRTRRRNTINGMEQRCRNGWYPSRPPYGYEHRPLLDEHGRPKKRGSTIEGPSDEAYRLIRREAELRHAGYSIERIRARCLEEGLVPASRIPSYHRSTVEKHLKNKFYAGLPRPHDGFKSQFEWRGVWYEGKHEPIFTAREWEALQATFGQQPRYRRRKHEGLFASGPLVLACADPECGCKITYAPKDKGGKTYHYYRCANGKRVHTRRGEPQLNVHEQDILEQLGDAVDMIEITEDLAEAIAHALNETHREAQAARKQSADVFRAQLEALDSKEDRLYDRLDTGEIDSAAYKRQRARLRAERDDLVTKLEDANREIDDAYMVTAQRVLELAKNAKTLWETRSREERRDFLAQLLLNPTLDGGTVRFDLKKPFALLAEMRRAEDWRPHGGSNSGYRLERAGSWATRRWGRGAPRVPRSSGETVADVGARCNPDARPGGGNPRGPREDFSGGVGPGSPS